MGRIKSTLIKKAAKQLIDRSHSFTESFEYNKKLLQGRMPSKSTSNKVAGYIAHLEKMRRIEKLQQAKKEAALLASSSPSII